MQNFVLIPQFCYPNLDRTVILSGKYYPSLKLPKSFSSYAEARKFFVGPTGEGEVRGCIRALEHALEHALSKKI